MTKRTSLPLSFDPATGTIDASNLPNFDPRRVVAILAPSAADRPVIYDIVTPGCGFKSTSGSTMVVEYDTSGISAQDDIVIVWDDEITGTFAVANPASVLSGRVTVALTAQALPAAALTNGVVIKSHPDNAGTIYVGHAGLTSATGYPLDPGESVPYGVANLSAIYCLGQNTTDVLLYTGN